MAITCKLCNTVLDAFSGGRCRKCRQLVCKDCIASGGATNAAGLLCKTCAAAEAALAAAAQITSAAAAKEALFAAVAPTAEPTSISTSAPSAAKLAWQNITLPARRWLLLPLLVIGLFFVIVALPWTEAWWYLRQLKTDDEIAATAAMDRLGEIGSRYVVHQLCALAEQAPEPARSRAVLTLGKIPTREVREFLQELQREIRNDPTIAPAVIEALRDQERQGMR